MSFDGEKVEFWANVERRSRYAVHVYRDLLEFLGFPATVHRSRPGIYAIPRPMPNMSRLLVLTAFLVN